MTSCFFVLDQYCSHKKERKNPVIYCLFVSAVVFGTHDCLYLCLDVFTFFTLIHFLSSAFLPRLNRSRLHSCSGSSVLPRDQEVQGGEEEERWPCGQMGHAAAAVAAATALP